MNTESAYKVLGVNDQMDEDEIQDIIENKVFEIKQKILNPPQLPKVLEVQKDRLLRLQKAVEVIDSSYEQGLIEEEDAVVFSGLNFTENYKKYDEQQRAALLKVANSNKLAVLAYHIKCLIDVTRAWYLYVFKWSKQYPQLTNFDHDIAISKAQEPVSLFKSVKVLQERYQGVLPEKLDDIEVLEPLVKECMRITKYCSTYES